MPLFFWFDLSLEARAETLCLFFGRIKDTIICFWDLLTFTSISIPLQNAIALTEGGIVCNIGAVLLHAVGQPYKGTALQQKIRNRYSQQNTQLDYPKKARTAIFYENLPKSFHEKMYGVSNSLLIPSKNS